MNVTRRGKKPSKYHDPNKYFVIVVSLGNYSPAKQQQKQQNSHICNQHFSKLSFSEK
jgi:hypothetical protein